MNRLIEDYLERQENKNNNKQIKKSKKMRNLKRLATVGLVVLGLGFNTSCESDDSNVYEVVQNVININGVWLSPIQGEDNQGEYIATLKWEVQGETLIETVYGRTLNDIKRVNNKTVSVDDANQQMTVTDSYGNITTYDIVSNNSNTLVVQGIGEFDFVMYNFVK
tara:strand:+ start:3484 stop:3978 length:495 start_codon:yes stop_codon:yes gene_type:complete